MTGPAAPGGDNTYPGCACDVPSMFYSFSFETKRDWSRLFPGQAEILGYLEDCVEKHALTPHLRCNVEVARAEFQESKACWRLELADGEVLQTTVLVSSVGQLNQPAWPDLDGMDRFKGINFHSALWDHGSNLSGKRVAVIGNGCSAAQFVPEVAKEAAAVSVFQRSAHWVIPRNDHAFSPAVLKAFQRFPLLVKLYRYFIWLRYEFTLFPIMRRTSKRRAKLEEAALEHLKSAIDDPANDRGPDAGLRNRLQAGDHRRHLLSRLGEGQRLAGDHAHQPRHRNRARTRRRHRTPPSTPSSTAPAFAPTSS